LLNDARTVPKSLENAVKMAFKREKQGVAIQTVWEHFVKHSTLIKESGG